MSEIMSKTIRCAGGLPAFLAMPVGAAKVPAIVLMHERYGLVKHTCDLAERLARDGFVAIAPDFFHRHPDQDALHRGDAAYPFKDDEAVEHIDAAIAELSNLPQVDRGKIAVQGVCQTGRHPLVFAARHPIAAALIWYGAAAEKEWEMSERFPQALDDIIARVDCPVLGIFGESDHVISLADVRRFRDCLDRHDKSYTIKVYPGAPHGWLNDTMPGRYRPAQAEAAWAEQLAFLREALAADYDRTTRRQHYACECALDYDFRRNVRLA
jgi:carboxymethylenebutenolidase